MVGPDIDPRPAKPLLLPWGLRRGHKTGRKGRAGCEISVSRLSQDRARGGGGRDACREVGECHQDPVVAVVHRGRIGERYAGTGRTAGIGVARILVQDGHHAEGNGVMVAAISQSSSWAGEAAIATVHIRDGQRSAVGAVGKFHVGVDLVGRL